MFFRNHLFILIVFLLTIICHPKDGELNQWHFPKILGGRVPDKDDGKNDASSSMDMNVNLPASEIEAAEAAPARA